MSTASVKTAGEQHVWLFLKKQDRTSTKPAEKIYKYHSERRSEGIVRSVLREPTSLALPSH